MSKSKRRGRPNFPRGKGNGSGRKREDQYKADRRPMKKDDSPRLGDDRDNTCAKGYPLADRVHGANDVSWYTKYPDIIVPASLFQYPYRPGMQLPVVKGNVAGYASISIPGVMSIPWIPTLGYGVDNTDPPSVVAKEIYSQVRKAYSGSLEADAPDFIMYLMALDSIYAYLAWCKRVFRTINAYSPNNYATPDTLLAAYGFSESQISQLRARKERFWEHINTLVYMSRKFTCPAVMPIFNRHYWLSDNVYTDADTMNSQFYIFNPIAFLEYGEAHTPQGEMASGLHLIKFDTRLSAMTDVVEDLFTFGENMISELVTWDEAYTINGYLQRAYDGTPNFIVETIPYDEMLTPVYNEEVLSQIENLRPIPGFRDTNFISTVALEFVYQDPTTNTVISNNRLPITVTEQAANTLELRARTAVLLSIRSDNPTSADNIIATRMVNTATFTYSESAQYVDIRSGTEIVGQPTIWLSPTASCVGQTITNWGPQSTVSSVYTELAYALYMNQFDWCPGVLLLYGDGSGTLLPTFSRDIHNVTAIAAEDIANLHRQCLYSEFNAFNF